MEDQIIENIGKYLQGLNGSLSSEMDNITKDIGYAVLNGLSEDRIRDLKKMHAKMIGEQNLILKLFRTFPELNKKQ